MAATNVFLVFAGLAALSLAAPSGLSWNKVVMPYLREGVSESIEVVDDGRKQTVRMLANDKLLSVTPFQGSTSFHDFKPQKKFQEDSLGLVALKSVSGCFVTEVAKSFSEVIAEAKERTEKRLVVLDRPQQAYRVADKVSDIKEYSSGIADFCSEKPVYRLKPMALGQVPTDVFINPQWLLCIWIPYPIYFPEKLASELNVRYA